MTLDVDLQSKLSTVAAVPVSENVSSENTAQPRVWWQRREGNVDLLLNGNTSMIDTSYDVEVYGLDVDATASVADSLKTTLHGFRGTMGSSTVLAMFVKDHSDDYISKAQDADEGYHVFAFDLQILS